MTTTIATNLEARIREVLAEKSLLKHPFYVEWTKGTLPVEKLQEYGRQYFHFESAFPRFLSAIHTRTESPAIRQLILDNLWDEEHGERNHPALWLEFAEALGVPADEVRASKPNAQTTALVDHFHQVAREAPIAEAMATLFAYEGQVPEVAWQKIRGLTDFYNFTPKQFEFFSVHLVADFAHSGAEIDAINECCENEGAVIDATRRSCDLLLQFLDGCYATPGVN